MCNGWNNYETWSVALFFMDSWTESFAGETKPAQYELQERLKDEVREYVDSLGVTDSFVSQIMTATINDVDFYTLAAHLLEDVQWMEESDEH
mgnify:CR=1 FL=1